MILTKSSDQAPARTSAGVLCFWNHDGEISSGKKSCAGEGEDVFGLDE